MAALEAYPEQVTEADTRYAEVREIERLAAGSSELLALLARTAADDLAAAEIEGLADEVAVVASTFTRALESAKQAAVAALPLKSAAQPTPPPLPRCPPRSARAPGRTAARSQGRGFSRSASDSSGSSVGE
ncbi:hypothetical protein ABZX77_17415 [Streptomyces sp. NPDC004237]|uniref:hypothetical protein n=1 Tax=Streptomyces sp. NPDC004237 TaxID=3154455 RepID=UPI0033A1DF8B